jgi:hypothetical protein
VGVPDRHDVRAVELARNQTKIPSLDRIRFGNAGHCCQVLPAQALGDLGQGRAFGVGEPQAPGDVGAEDAILRDQVFALQEQALVYPASDVRQ